MSAHHLAHSKSTKSSHIPLARGKSIKSSKNPLIRTKSTKSSHQSRSHTISSSHAQHQSTLPASALPPPTQPHVSHANTFAVHHSGPMPESVMLHRSRYIRSELAPKYTSDPPRPISPTAIADLTVFLIALDRQPTPITIPLLRRTRLEKALQTIAAPNSPWPAQLVEMSRKLLKAWERRLGCIDDLRADLWAEGGRMEGCVKVKSAIEPRQRIELVASSPMNADPGPQIPSPERMRKVWMVTRPTSRSVIERKAINNRFNRKFDVGEWWMNPACAFRDGILDDANSHIATDGYGATTIVMARGEEESVGEEVSRWHVTSASVKRSGQGKGVLSLMANMRNHKDVRVLRGWKLESVLSPRGGVRYDGLYRVIGVGFKRIDLQNHYSFELKRNEDQPSLSRVLKRPLPDEYDDWCDYKVYKAERKLSEQSNIVQLDGGETGRLGLEAERCLSRQEIYSTPRWGADGEKRGEVGASRFHLAPQGRRVARKAWTSEEYSPGCSESGGNKEGRGECGRLAEGEASVRDSGYYER